MNKMLRCAAMACAVCTAALAGSAQASVLATFGAGSSVKVVTNSASFTGNTALASHYVEDGLLFSYTGSANNNGCGYAGIACYDDPGELSPAFDGNYMATAGNNAYVSIRRADGQDIYHLEFAAGSGYLHLNGYWKTYNDGVQTGAGNFSQPDGAILGLSDLGGFDEVRYYAFAVANRTSGFSAAAIDDVRIGLPEPGTVLLMAAGWLGLGRRMRRRS